MKHTTLFTVIFIAGSFLIPLLLFEVYLRIAGVNASFEEQIGVGGYHSPFYVDNNQGWIYTYTPGAQRNVVTKEFSFSVGTNSEGCNDKEWSLQKTKKRIFCIGDSFTDGAGATRDSSYPNILQSLLGDSVEICNGGISGSDPFYGYILLKERFLKYKPDMVLLTINQSDINDGAARGGFERFKKGGSVKYKQGPWWEFFYGKFYTVRYIVNNICRNNKYFLTEVEQKHVEHKVRKDLTTCVDSITQLCSVNNIIPVFVFHPMRFEITAGNLECDSVLDYCDQHNLNAVNVLDYYLANGLTEKTITDFYWEVDGHHNNAGYSLLARSVQQYLQPAK